MGRFEFNITLLDHYIATFSRMSKGAREYLIEKLKGVENEPKKEKNNSDLFGAWQSEESADEIIDMIYSSKSNNREIEQF